MRNVRSREIIIVIVLFLVLALLLGAGTEIWSIPSNHDDAFYAQKSLSLFGTWAETATIKEIGSPLFFALVRTVSVPLRLAFSLCYAFALFLLWLELRRWPFPGWLALAAALLPMFMPAQYLVFMRCTADPLNVFLTICLLTFCMAIYRSNASWTSTTCAGFTAAAMWLNRPEGILAILAVIFTLLLLKMVKPQANNPLRLAPLALRIATVIGILWATILSINALNLKYYGIPAATIMKTRAYCRAINLLSTIDDGEPPQRGRPVSKRALNLAFENSPTMATSRTYWKNNTDGRGWSSVNFPEYSPKDGSVDGGHFQFAFRGSGAAVAGIHPGDQLRFFEKIADELEHAMDTGALPHRRVPGYELGSSFSISNRLLWQSIWETGRLMFSGQGPIFFQKDIASIEQNRMIDLACTRRNALGFSSLVHVRGWMVVPERQEMVSLMLVTDMPEGATFRTLNRPDVIEALFKRKADTAPCGFELSAPSKATSEMSLLVKGNGNEERFLVSELMESKNADIHRNGIHVHLDEVRATAPDNITTFHEKKWTTMNAAGTQFSQIMTWSGFAGAFALMICIVWRMRNKGQNATWDALIGVTLICAAIIGPRWFLLSAIHAFRFTTEECRLQMPGTVLAWVWVVLAIGTASLLMKKPASKYSKAPNAVS